MDRSAGVIIIAIGLIAVVIGLLALSGALGWFGRLPGDIHVRNSRVQFYFPIVSMLVVSIALTLAINVLRRFL